MLIAEFQISGDLLETALKRAPEMVLTNEEEYIAGDDIRVLFWAEGGDFDAFEAGLDADPTVTAPRVLAEINDRRLYRVDLTDEGAAVTTLPIWPEEEIVLLEVTATHNDWVLRLRVPDRDSLAVYREALRERGLDFELQTLYHDIEARGPAEASLTAAQTDALVTAYERGYYNVPREASQSEIAEQLGITPQSLSERLQRGTATLIETALLSGPAHS